jgi:hypothetical protein
MESSARSGPCRQIEQDRAGIGRDSACSLLKRAVSGRYNGASRRALAPRLAEDPCRHWLRFSNSSAARFVIVANLGPCPPEYLGSLSSGSARFCLAHPCCTTPGSSSSGRGTKSGTSATGGSGTTREHAWCSAFPSPSSARPTRRRTGRCSASVSISIFHRSTGSWRASAGSWDSRSETPRRLSSASSRCRCRVRYSRRRSGCSRA